MSLSTTWLIARNQENRRNTVGSQEWDSARPPKLKNTMIKRRKQTMKLNKGNKNVILSLNRLLSPGVDVELDIRESSHTPACSQLPGSLKANCASALNVAAT